MSDGLRPAKLEHAHKLLDELSAEIVRLRDELSQRSTSEKHLYEVNDEITTWATPEGTKTSIKTTIIKGFRLL